MLLVNSFFCDLHRNALFGLVIQSEWNILENPKQEKGDDRQNGNAKNIKKPFFLFYFRHLPLQFYLS